MPDCTHELRHLRSHYNRDEGLLSWTWRCDHCLLTLWLFSEMEYRPRACGPRRPARCRGPHG